MIFVQTIQNMNMEFTMLNASYHEKVHYSGISIIIPTFSTTLLEDIPDT